MDYDKTIDQLTGGFDLDSDVGRREAYERCIEYADRELDGTLDYNPFLDVAADKLDQEPVRKDIVRSMIEQSGREKLHLTYREESGPELTGNAAGLSYLSAVLDGLSKATMNGEHSHFFSGRPPLCGKSFPLTIYLEDDDWFEEHTGDDDNGEKDDTAGRRFRDIDVGQIEAFMLLSHVPIELMATPDRIYRVLACEKYEGQDIWVKMIREQSERVFTFAFMRDDGERQQLALDIDDKEVAFLTKDHLSQLV
ncbi:MAG: hypothetical protein ACYS0H_14425 [Planctomycetota bacterium]